MTVPIIAFFNNKGGVGKTSLVYHLAWMYQNLGLRSLVILSEETGTMLGQFWCVLGL